MAARSLDYVTTLLEAVAHQEAGRLAEAEAGFQSVLAVEPEQPQALLFGGLLANKRGDADAAVELLRRAAAVRPSHAESQFALGNALWAAGRKGEAQASWRAVLTLARQHVGALLNLARAHQEAGEIEAAIECCERAVAAAPGQALPLAALAAALRAGGQLHAALAAAEVAVALGPDLPDPLFQLGTVLKALGRLPEAARALRRAGRHGPALLNLANVLNDVGEPEEALRCCRAAIAADPGAAEAHAMLGFLLTQAGQLPEAIAACAEGVRLRPDLAEAHWNMGIAQLSAGDLPGGFAQYEWRKRHRSYANQFLRLPPPEWRGQDVCGKRLLVVTEQGLGDAIMFARYAKLLAARGAEVILACDMRLLPLLRHAPGVSAAVPKSLVPPPCDFWVDQMSLPLLCGTTVDTIPSPGPYLAADPARIAAWRERLPPWPEHVCRVGLVWSGNPLHSNDAARSCPAEAFLPLVRTRGLEAVSLQVGPSAAQAGLLGLQDLSPQLTDYAETAALIMNLDLVVTVDTSVAHLAGAMGQITWVMLPHTPDWRWLRDRSDSPWYDSVRLFRQSKPGDWTGVVRDVTAAARAATLPGTATEPSFWPDSPADFGLAEV